MLLFFLIAIFSALLQLFLPWWSMVLAAVLLSFSMGKTFRHSFFSGLLGCGIVWPVYALFVTAFQGNLMTQRIAALFSLPASWILFVIGFLVAAIAGGMGAWTGYSLKRIISKQ